jgi:hypothetical protein
LSKCSLRSQVLSIVRDEITGSLLTILFDRRSFQKAPAAIEGNLRPMTSRAEHISDTESTNLYGTDDKEYPRAPPIAAGNTSASADGFRCRNSLI